MKPFFIYITPIVIACFLTATTDSLCQSNGISTNTVVIHKASPKELTPTDYSSVTATNLTLSYSLNLTDWGTLYNMFGQPLTTIDLSNATVNPTNGLRELYVEAFVCTNALDSAFIQANVTYVTDTGTNFLCNPTSMSVSVVNNPPPVVIVGPQLVEACAGLIIAIVVIIVGAIIIYVLVKTCNRLLPPPKKSGNTTN